MLTIYGIYGYEFTRAFSMYDLNFLPRTMNHVEAKTLARNQSLYKLTGVIYSETIDEDVIFNLEGILSFIEHLDVKLIGSREAETISDDVWNLFDSEISANYRNGGGGAVIGSDAFNPYKTSRSTFIALAYSRLIDKKFCKTTRFSQMFFKNVESFRQRQPFLEISYFLLISGLEAFCRAGADDYVRPAAIPMTNYLKSLGFNVYQRRRETLPRSISTYLDIRNALFHNGEFVAKVRFDDILVDLNCVDYLFHLQMLCSLVIMKAVECDDGHINWDCWIDRNLLK